MAYIKYGYILITMKIKLLYFTKLLPMIYSWFRILTFDLVRSILEYGAVMCVVWQLYLAKD